MTEDNAEVILKASRRSAASETFRLLQEFGDKLGNLVSEMHTLAQRVGEREADTRDHEARIRKLEVDLITFMAAKMQSEGQRHAAWVAIFNSVHSLSATGALFVAVYKLIH